MRDRLLFASAALVLVAMALSAWWPGESSPTPSASTDAAEEGRRRRRPRARRSRPARDRSPLIREVREREFIDGVEVEPAVACVGDDVVVTTTLRDGLHGVRVVTGGRPGARVVLRFDEPGIHEVQAVANAWEAATDHESTVVEIEECGAHPSIAISTERLPLDRVRFRAEEAEGLEAPLTYRWDFGDGETWEGADPSVDHDYAFRRMQAPDSSFLIRLEVEDAEGRRAERRTHVHFVNAAYLSAWIGQPVLPARTPLFPREGPDGWTAAIEMSGLDLIGETELGEVRLTAFPCGGGPPQVVTLAAAEALSQTRVAPGTRTTVGLHIPRDTLPAGTCDVEARLLGSSSGLPTEAILPLRVGLDPGGRRLTGAEADRVRDALRARGVDRATYAELGLLPGGGPSGGP
jgi:hypothetical protein